MKPYRKTLFSSAALLCIGLVGCRFRDQSPPLNKNLTAAEYQALSDKDKTKFKNIPLRIPAQWGGAILPVDAGPYKSPVDKTVHAGDLATLIGLYNQAVFELQFPRVKVEYINFDMWTDNFRSALAVALSSGAAPAYYIARDLPQTIEQGMYADLTPLMKKWDQFDKQPEGSIREGTVNGKIYTLAANELGASVIRYRKDWFREAGIFNEKGEPGPPINWTWNDFRAIAKRLTDPAKGRNGFAYSLSSMFYNECNNIDMYVPDPSGKYDWRFNEKDPDVLASLQAARDMVVKDKSITPSVSMGWFEWHNEFDAGRVAMVSSFSPHLIRESLTAPTKMGTDKVYRDTVGMALLPKGPADYDGLRPITNPVGFDPTLTPEQLEAAFEWCKSWFYGDAFANRMRASSTEAKLKNQQNVLYAEVFVLPYAPKENLVDKPFEQIFPPDYLRAYKAIRSAHAPPLPREFGLKEPPQNELTKAVNALYSEAITSPNADLKALIAKHANLINTNLLRFGGAANRDTMRRYLQARSEFYKQYFPRYYETVWKNKLATWYRVP